MNIHRVEMYLIPLESWEGAEHYPVDGIGIRCLVVEESDIESKGNREVSILNIYRTGTYLIPLESCTRAGQCPVDRFAIGHLIVEESSVESESARKGPSSYCS